MADLYPIVNETEDTILRRLRDSLAHYLPGVSTGPDTVLGRVLASHTDEFARIYRSYADVAAINMWHGAYGEFLDHKGIELGIVRGTDTAATVRLRFEGAAGLEVPAGTEVSTNDTVENPATFVTLARLVLPSTGYGEAWAESSDQGTNGNVPADTLTVLDSDVPGVVMVTNEAPATGGTDVESDDDYSARLFAAWADAPTGTGSRSDYQRWSREAAPGIESAKVAGSGSVPELSGISDAERFNAALGVVPIAPYPADRSTPTAEQLFRVQEFIDPGNLVIHSEMDGWVLPSGAVPRLVPQPGGTGAAINRQVLNMPATVGASLVPVGRFVFPFPRDLSRILFADATMSNNVTPAVIRFYAAYSDSNLAVRLIDTTGNYVTSQSFTTLSSFLTTSVTCTWTASGSFNPAAVTAFEFLCQMNSVPSNNVVFASCILLGRRAEAVGRVPRNISCVVLPPQRLTFSVNLPSLTLVDPSLRDETVVQIREKVIAEYGIADTPDSATLTRIIASVPNVASVSSTGTVAAPASGSSYDVATAALLATPNIEVTVG